MIYSYSILCIVGPTAVGKSRVGYDFAKFMPSEIISCDSMQVYKEINIVTDKPSQLMRDKIPHHLIDIVSVKDKFDVVNFRDEAIKLIEDLHKRNRLPIVVGGTGFYLEVLLDGIFEGGGSDPALRAKLLEQAEIEGKQVLHKQLADKDPDAAAKIHPNDLKKIVRALEVCIKSNAPISNLQQNKVNGLWEDKKYLIKVFGLRMDREVLYKRIEQRIDEMFDRGVVDEIKEISKLPISYTAKGALGFKEIMGYLYGEYSLDQAKTLLKRNTRRFAKRQMTWFRRDKRIEWIDVDEKASSEDIANCIYDKWKNY